MYRRLSDRLHLPTTLLTTLQHDLHGHLRAVSLHLLRSPTHLLPHALPALALHHHLLLALLLARALVTHTPTPMPAVLQRLPTHLPAREQPFTVTALPILRRLPTVAPSLHNLLARRAGTGVTIHQRTWVVAGVSALAEVTTYVAWCVGTVAWQRTVLFG